ncbi:MAG: methylamine utilization protein [Pseudomonadota bacterium]
MTLLSILLAAMAGAARSAEFTVDVLDVDGAPLPGAVVFLEPNDPASLADASPAPGVMDQVDSQFMPHILVVQRGAAVAFPNSDSIKHHVFSFSPAKSFEIKLYKGERAEPLIFEERGEVELGCNVHDWMLGYIYVVDSPFFSRTDEEGRGRIEAPSTEYTLGVWHPRIDAPNSLLTQSVNPDVREVRINLKNPLLPEYVPSEAVEFDDYD